MDKERKAKNRKRTTSYNSEGSSISGSSSEGEAASTSDLGLIMSKLLRTTTTTDQPVLAKRKAVERQLEEEKLEKRARALVRQELWERRDSAHVVPNMESANYEKGLLVQLFNAVHQLQVNKEKAEMAAKEAKGARKKETAVKADIKEVSKSSFLELLKMGGISRKSTAQ